jgi:hypothetical protein
LAAPNANFQKSGRLEFPEEQEPHGVKSVFPKTTPFLGKILAMRLELRRQFEMKIAMAFPIEGGGVFKAARPVCAGDFCRRAFPDEGFLFNPATHPANAALQKWDQWHNDRELFIFGLSAALAT